MIATGLLCLALNIFWEARSEPVETQIGVAAVTMNRAKEEDSKAICETVYEPSAFSWTSSRSKRKIKHEDQIKNHEDRKAFIRAKEIAHLYLQGKLKNPVGSSLYFNHKRLGKRYKTPNKPIVISQLMYY